MTRITAQGGESKIQNLHGEVEGVWDEVRGLQKSTRELTEITDGLRCTVEGSELRGGATVLLHGLVSRGDLNSQLGLLGTYDEAKGRWAVRLPEGEKVWIKGENLWAADGLKARMSMTEHIMDEENSGLL